MYDNTTLYFNIEDYPLQSREADINNGLKKVNTWLQLNKLSLNTDKSMFILFLKKNTTLHALVWGNNFEVISKLKKELFKQLHIVITLPIQSPYLNS